MGHVSPNLALIPSLVTKFDEIHYIGSENGIEKTKIAELSESYPCLFYHPIPSAKLNRSNPFKNLTLPFVLIKAFKKSKKLLKEINPSVVFSKGGYVSVPVVRSASKLSIPTVIHESDLSMGLANSICAKKASAVCTTFQATSKKLKNGIWTGSPVSNKLLSADKSWAVFNYKLNPKLKTITITGGSLGSVAINSAIEKILPELVKNYNIIHLTGKGKRVDFSHSNYHQVEFSNNIGSIFKASDLVISRAGSNTIFELALLKIPMLLIPLSKKASRGDQIENADYFKTLKIANVIQEEELSKLDVAIENSIKQIPEIKTALIKQNFTNGLYPLLNEILKAEKR